MDRKRGGTVAGLCAVAFLWESTARAQTAPPPPPPPPPTFAPTAPPPPLPPPPPSAHDPAKEPAPATAGPALSAVPAPTAAELRYRRMSVYVDSSRPNAVLERRVSLKEDNGVWFVVPVHNVESTWEQVCISPCQGADLDRYSTYRVAKANRISGSPSFTLPQGDRAVHLKLDAGSAAAHRVGLTMSSIGGAAIIVGSVLIVAAKSFNKTDDVRTAGWITAGSGALVLGIGLPIALMTGTRVFADNHVRVADAPKPRWTATGYAF